MEKPAITATHWMLHRFRTICSATMVSAIAMAVPSAILLVGFSLTGLLFSTSFQPSLMFVFILVFTLIFPLIIVTFDAIRKMETLVEQVKDVIKYDGLTRVLSRSYFLDLVRGSHQDGYVLIVDADNFKRINDSYGHGVGDAVLVELALSIEWGAGPLGQVGRLGGEEFGVFLPNVTGSLALKLAEDIRTRVSRHPVIVDGAEINLTVSIGAAPYTSGHLLRTALSAADRNLFRAKERGRNAVVFDHASPDLEDEGPALRVVR